MAIHSFAKSRQRGNARDLEPVWQEVYRQAFPDLRAMVRHDQDGWHQRAGIDRTLVLKDSRQIRIDEKARFSDYGDVALEVWSDLERRSPGWVQKPMAADFIAYAVLPSGTCYLLPVLQLQRAWRERGNAWLTQFGEVSCETRGQDRAWVSVSCPVPVDTLFAAIGAQLRVGFQAQERG